MSKQNSPCLSTGWLRFSWILLLILFGVSSTVWGQAYLESPTSDAFVESGVSLIRGWACDAEQIEISIDDGERRLTAYGTKRGDTQQVCGDTNNGFGLTFNWNNIGDGVHNVKAYADGVQFADTNFTVTTLGSDFLTGLQGHFALSNFPTSGISPSVRWSEPHQNFVFVSNTPVPDVSEPPDVPRTYLESPSQGSPESGVGLIRGWVCEANRVEVSIDGGELRPTAYGTKRGDTQETCGDTNNGFGLTFNWNGIDDGVHNLKAYADGVEFANVNFAVTTLGQDYLTGVEGKFDLPDFPAAGQKTNVRWSEPHQNFLIEQTTATGEKISTISAVADQQNRFAVIGLDSALQDSFGVRVTKDSNGETTDIHGVTWTDTTTGESADLSLSEDGLPAVYTDSADAKAHFSDYNTEANTATVRFTDANDNTLGEPVENTPVDTGLLKSLQELVSRVRSTAVDGEEPTDKTLRQLATNESAHTSNSPSPRFSLKALLVRMAWSGGVAAGETLCSVKTAAERAGISRIVAPQGCQSTMLSSFVGLARTQHIQADDSSDNLDPLLAQMLNFSEDIQEAPCETSDDSAVCLQSATEVSQVRESVPIPVAEPEPDDVEVPAIPRGVDASDGTYTDLVRVTWSAVDGVSSYEVYRSDTAESTGVRIGTVTVTFFDDATVMQDAVYFYQVKACNNDGCSQLSTANSGYAQQEIVVPEYPTGLSASDGMYTDQVVVSWNAVSGAEYYEVYRSTSSGTTGSQISQPTSTHYTDTSAVLGQTYWYSVRACNNAGCSGFSAADSGYLAQNMTHYTLVVSREGNGEGSVTSNPSGINCGSICSSDFEDGTTVTLSATAEGNSSFAGWSGACSGTETSCTVITNQTRNVTATFLQGQSGDVRVNLSWSNAADLDLHVIDPCGNRIYFDSSSASCQGSIGTLDVDANAVTVVSNPAENIFWEGSPPTGNYQVEVCYYPSRDAGTTAYNIYVQAGSSTINRSGSIAYEAGNSGNCQQVTEFSY